MDDGRGCDERTNWQEMLDGKNAVARRPPKSQHTLRNLLCCSTILVYIPKLIQGLQTNALAAMLNTQTDGGADNILTNDRQAAMLDGLTAGEIAAWRSSKVISHPKWHLL